MFVRKHGKSFFGKGTGKPVFTKNGFPVKVLFKSKSINIAAVQEDIFATVKSVDVINVQA